jgi:hypothetical protein
MAAELELLALIDECERKGDERGAAFYRQHLDAARALTSGDLDRVRKAERRLGRPLIGKVTLDRSPKRCAPTVRARERRERRGRPRARRTTASRDGPDPPPRSPAPPTGWRA